MIPGSFHCVCVAGLNCFRPRHGRTSVQTEAMTLQSGSPNLSRSGERTREWPRLVLQWLARTLAPPPRAFGGTLVALVMLGILAQNSQAAAEPGKVDFLREVRP